MRGLTAGIGILAFTLACFAQHLPSGSSGSSSERSASESRSSDSSSAHASDSGAGHTASSPGPNRGSSDSSATNSASATASGRAATNDRNNADGRMRMPAPPTAAEHGKPASHPPVAGNGQKHTAQPKSQDSIHLIQLIAECRANGGFLVNGHCLPPGVVGLGPHYYSCVDINSETQRACRLGNPIRCQCPWEFLNY